MSAASLSARIAELERMLHGTDIAALTLTEGGETIILRRNAVPGHAAEAARPALAEATPDVVVAAPCPGTVLSRHPLRNEALVTPGQAVAAGDVLGLLQAGPLLLAVTAPCAGTLLAAEAADGALAGYGTPLFRLLPEPEEP